MDELHDDDQPVGRLLSRRDMLRFLGGAAGIALLSGSGVSRLIHAQGISTATATALPSCVVRPELTEGPYFVAHALNRFDIRHDPTDESLKAGLPLLLRFRVTDVSNGACAPLEGAQVDVWQCDSDGEYSGVQDAGFDNSGALWLRGFQFTDDTGMAEFLTIVPGWYSGRAVHIHFKIRTELADSTSYEYTSQFFFDPDLIETIYADPPYAAKGLPDMPNERDGIYQQSDGQLTLTLNPLTEDDLDALQTRHEEDEFTDTGDLTTGYVALFDVGLDLTDLAVGASDSAGGGGGMGGGGFPGGGGAPGGRGGRP